MLAPLLLALFAVLATSAVAEPATWSVPDIARLPDDANGRLVRYGRDLVEHTVALIGPDAPKPVQRFAGNGLVCSNCHINAGTTHYALPFVGITSRYPVFSARIGAMQTLARRVNDCMERSMNGRPLPTGSREMQALLAYLKFLDVPVGDGRGAPELPLPTRAADPQRGATVFRDICAACHQADGLGVKLQLGTQIAQQRRYQYPPLWGPDSYNDAAGMARIVTSAWFVNANMPRGISHTDPLLAADDAYDVMAFVDTQPRPHKRGLMKEYPDQWLKPVGTLYPPWPGPFSAAQNRFGPWQPILAWRQKNKPALLAEPPAASDLEQVLSVAR